MRRHALCASTGDSWRVLDQAVNCALVALTHFARSGALDIGASAIEASDAGDQPTDQRVVPTFEKSKPRIDACQLASGACACTC